MQAATVTTGRAPDQAPVATAIRRATGALRAMHKSSPVAIDGPTPERVAQAGADFEIGEAIRSIEITKGSQRQTEQIRTPRARVGEDPFTRMLQRGELDPDCEDTNRTLGAAGMRYRRLHEIAGRSEIRAQDFTKGFTTASGPSAVLDRSLDAWTGWDRARSSVAPEMRAALDGIVLDGQKLEAIGSGLSRYADPKRRSVVALTALRFALAALDRHFAQVDANGLDVTGR